MGNCEQHLATCTHILQLGMTKCVDSWPFCENPVCPDPVRKPVMLQPLARRGKADGRSGLRLSLETLDSSTEAGRPVSPELKALDSLRHYVDSLYRLHSQSLTPPPPGLSFHIEVLKAGLIGSLFADTF